VVALICVLPIAGCGSGDKKTIMQSNSVQMVKEDDPDMLRAFARANDTLDVFLARLAANDPAIADPALKVKVQDGNAVEYLWVTSPAAIANGYSGIIDNNPELVKNVRIGEALSFPRSRIYDWTYHDAKTGKTVGNFTACALLAHESPASAGEFRNTYQIDCDP